MKRRHFLQTGVIAAGAAALPRQLLAGTPAKPGILKLGSQEGRVPGDTLREKVANLEKWGATGLEIGGDPSGRIPEIKAAICRKINHPGICLMEDFHHMGKEGKSDSEAFTTGAPWLHHVHLASRVRWLPGQDQIKEPDQAERSFVDGLRALHRIGYQDYCSLECGVARGKDPLQAISAAFDFLRRQWAEATAG